MLVTNPSEWLRSRSHLSYAAAVREYRRQGGRIPYDPGYVYAIEAEGTNFIKIGKTKNPDKRLLQIAPKMPFRTRYLKVWPSNFMSLSEKMIHEYCAACRVNGEWFEIPKGMESYLFSDWHGSLIENSYGMTFWTSIGGEDLHHAVVKDLYRCASELFGISHIYTDFASVKVIETLFCEISASQAKTQKAAEQ